MLTSRPPGPRRPRALALTGLLALLAVACGRVRDDDPGVDPIEPPPTEPPGAACTSAFACPDGQRCDDGVCQLDIACPAAIAPRRLREAGPGAPNRWYMTNLAGRDYAQLTLENSPQDRTSETLLDVLTGQLTVWSHEPGSGSLGPCKGGVCGSLRTATGYGRIFPRVERQGDEWVAGPGVDLPVGYDRLVGLDGVSGAGTLGLLGKSDLRALDPATGESTLVASLDSRTWVGVVATPEGPRMMTSDASSKDQVSYFTAPLTPGASWSPYLEVKAPWDGNGPALVGAPDAWFGVHVTFPDGDVSYNVYRIKDGVQTLRGTGHDFLFRSVAIGRLTSGQQLGADHIAYTPRCLGATCAVTKVDFDQVSITESGAVSVGDELTFVAASRPLACHAFDVLLGTTRDVPGGPPVVRELWYARLVP